MAQCDFYPDGWKLRSEWISRAHLHDRYVVWLVIAIEITTDGAVSELEKPQLYVVEVQKVEKSRDDAGGPVWHITFGRFEDGDWERLVENGGDFASVGFDMTVNAPVNRLPRTGVTRPNPRRCTVCGCFLASTASVYDRIDLSTVLRRNDSLELSDQWRRILRRRPPHDLEVTSR